MRQDKGASLRERLRQGASSFEFDALIQGVSNVDAAPEEAPAHPATMPAGLLSTPPSDRDGIRAALNTLGERLLQEAGRLAAALGARDAAEGGYYLARVNQVLELLRAVDPSGDLARRLRTAAAPPAGRRWPATTWSVYEFAESTLSGLLPPDADECFCTALLQAAIQATDARGDASLPVAG